MADDLSGIRFVLLGPVQVVGVAGDVLPIGPPKQQAMLAALAMRPGIALSMDSLTTALWDTGMPATAVPTVRTYAWRLRQLLARAGADGDMLVTAGDGYRLAVTASAVDSLKVEELAATARAATEPGEARRALADALAMWAGEPLAGVPGMFAERNRDRLNELRITLTEQLLETDLRLGRYEEVHPRLIEMIAEHPHRERPYALLMRALYAMGRQVDALDVFQRARRLLIDTYGIEPGAELVEAHDRVLRGDNGAGPAHEQHDGQPWIVPEPVEPVRQHRVVPAQLPPDLPDFVGRSAQAAELEALLTAPNGTATTVLAVVGMGGVGKTSLSVHLAHRVRKWYPDGQLHVDLGDPDGTGEPLSSAETMGLLLAGLGVRPEEAPESTAERRGLLRSLFDGRRMLILLDNVAQAGQIRDVLPGTPGCAVLVTSRTRLDDLPLTRQFVLDVFDADESLDLLGRGIGDQRMRAEREHALALVAACGHLPLAIRVLASRLAARPRRTLRSMVERLAGTRSPLAELRTGSLAVEVVFEVGYRQLPEQQADDFVSLAAVAGVEFGLAEAAAVLGLTGFDAELRLESLVDAAMLGEPYPARFRFHELLYSFALTRGRSPEREAAALDRLLAMLMATARRAFELAVPGDPTSDALGRGPLDLPGLPLSDLRAARAWVATTQDSIVLACSKAADAGLARQIGIGIDLLIAISPYGDELRAGRLATAARSLAEATARLTDPVPGSREHQRIVGRAAFLRSVIALHRGSADETEEHARRAVEAASAGEDPAILRQALNDLGLVAQLRHDYPVAVTCFDRATGLARRMGHRSGEVASSVNGAVARLRGGDARAALDACTSALALARSIGDDSGIGYTLYVLGLANQALGRHELAAERFTDCVRHCVAAGIRDREAHARYRLAESLLALDRVDEALVQAGLGLVRCEELGAERDQAKARMVLGRAHLRNASTAEALEQFTRAYEIFAALGLPEAEEAAEARSAAIASSQLSLNRFP